MEQFRYDMERPLVSIVMTAYNEEQYIRGSIASIKAQTYENWELIVVDDGSNDKSREIVAECAEGDARIVLIESEHVGRAEALNVGLRRANGSLIAIQDADDQARPKRIERQVSYLREHPEIDIVGGGCRFYDEKRTKEWTWMPPYNSTKIRRYALLGMPLPHTTIMFRRRVLEKVAGYRDRDYKDYDFVIRVLRHFEGSNLQHILVDVTIHDDSVMGSMQNLTRLMRTMRSRFYALRTLCPSYLVPVYVPLSLGAMIYENARYLIRRKL